MTDELKTKEFKKALEETEKVVKGKLNKEGRWLFEEGYLAGYKKCLEDELKFEEEEEKKKK